MDERIILFLSSGFNVNGWGSHLENHEYFKYIPRYKKSEKIDKVFQFYLDNCENMEKISMDEWMKEVQVNRQSVFNGTTYDWKKIVRKYIEKKMSKPVDTKKETVV